MIQNPYLSNPLLSNFYYLTVKSYSLSRSLHLLFKIYNCCIFEMECHLITKRSTFNRYLIIALAMYIFMLKILIPFTKFDLFFQNQFRPLISTIDRYTFKGVFSVKLNFN